MSEVLNDSELQKVFNFKIGSSEIFNFFSRNLVKPESWFAQLTQSKSKTQKQEVCTVSSIVLLSNLMGHNMVFILF